MNITLFSGNEQASRVEKFPSGLVEM